MKAEAAKPFVLHPAGESMVKLLKVEETEVSKEFQGPGKDTLQWAWRFQSRDVNPDDGEPYSATIWTNRRYGNTKAGLTRLYNNIVPGLSKLSPEKAKEKALDVDTEDFVGRWYEVNFIHAMSDKGTTKLDYLWIKPYVKTKVDAPPAPTPSADGEPLTKGDNPFD